MKPARTVQDGHSVSEQAVYAALWAAGADEGPDWRVVTMGYDAVARRTGLHRTSVRRIIISLKSKLSIEEVQREAPLTATGKTYRVFSYLHILRRRKQAGLVLVSRNRFVTNQVAGEASANACKVRPDAARRCSDTISPDTCCAGVAVGSAGWVTPELMEAGRIELARHRTLRRDGRERTVPPEPPDHEITRKILSCFFEWHDFAKFLKDLLGRCDTEQIRSYGFYLTAAQRRFTGVKS